MVLVKNGMKTGIKKILVYGKMVKKMAIIEIGMRMLNLELKENILKAKNMKHG